MNAYKTSLPVHYYEINAHREASPVALLNYLEEAAIRHSESVGCGIDRLLEAGQVWMLARWSLHMNRYPRWNEEVTIETWPSEFERFYATREFRITGGRDEPLGAASTRWIFFDLNRKRPVRVPPEIMERYGTNPQRMVEDTFPELPALDRPLHEMDFRVRLSDIDTNDHVNNTRYVEWLLETVPRPVHADYFASVIEAAYKKETDYGTTITSYLAETAAEPEEKRFIHRILDSSSGAELVKARTIWKKRQ